MAQYSPSTKHPVTLAISSQPAAQNVTEGQSATFTVVAAGSGTLGYQWFVNGAAIAGATSSHLNISTTALIDNANIYSVDVTDESGTIASDGAILTVDKAPVTLAITSQPAAQNVTEGQSATFTVVAAGSGILSYQWFVNDTAIPGAINDSLVVSFLSATDDGNVYRVDIADDNGSVSSNNATLAVTGTITDVPVTTTNIGQGTVDSNKNVGPRWVRIDFNSLATAIHTINVSWDSDADVRFIVYEANGTNLSSTVRGSNPGVWNGALNANTEYYIGLWSVDGIANYTATIEASVPLSFVSQPSGLIVTEGDNASFIVEAAGSGTLAYQWLADGIPLTGETEDSLTVFATTLAENATGYTVEVSNALETITSDAAILTVNEPLVLGLFSQEADTSTWMLDGPALTLDYNAGITTDGWGRALLRVSDMLLVGGDFTGIKPTRSGPVTDRAFLAALDAISGQPVSTFQIPFQIDSVVRSLALSPNGEQVYVGGDFGLLILDAVTGQLQHEVSVTDGGSAGRVFDIAVTNTQLYIGGDFNRVDNTFRTNIARLSLDGELDSSWVPSVTNGFSAGRSAPVQSLTTSPAGDKVYIGGNFSAINGTPVDLTTQNKRISMLVVSALDGTVQPERFTANIGNNTKGLTAHDIAVTDSYVIIAWGGPNYLTFHSLAGDRLKQYSGKGDVQTLQIVGDHVYVGHHGEFFGFLPNPIPQEALEGFDPVILKPFKLHSFRIDDPSFLPEQAWAINGAFGIWSIAASEDSIWVAGEIVSAGSNELPVEGLVRFPALD